MAGYGKNLGQVWIRDMQERAILPAHHALKYPQISLPSDHLSTPTISMTMT
jgi:hypothetical protein